MVKMALLGVKTRVQGFTGAAKFMDVSCIYGNVWDSKLKLRVFRV